MAHSRTDSVLYLLEPVAWLILELLVSSTSGASSMAHSRTDSVLYPLEPVAWLILELIVSSTYWSQ